MVRIAVLGFEFLALNFFSVQATDGKKTEPKGKEKVEFTGKLVHPVFALGGETTGTLIETKNGTYEMNLGGKKELLKLVETLKGKQIVVIGSVTVVKGVEIPERKIIAVTGIKEFK